MSRRKRKEREFKRRISEYNRKESGYRSQSKLNIIPTEGQQEYLDSILNNTLTLCTGPAGTGKTLLAALVAYKMIKEGEYDHIIIVRPAVPACKEKIGFLPGGIDEKMGPYAVPILYSLSKMMDQNTFSNFQKRHIKVFPMAFMRGMTFDNCIIILDEAQNTSIDQMKMFLTRIGNNCKVIVEGDEDQTDMKNLNGLSDAIERCENLPNVGIVELDESDIKRSGFVARILDRYK